MKIIHFDEVLLRFTLPHWPCLNWPIWLF